MEKNKTVLEAQVNMQVVEIMERVNKFLNQETPLKEMGKSIVAFVGPTKAGKSTLINCLMGTKLMILKDEIKDTTYLAKTSDERGPKIGIDGESETLKAESFDNLPDTDYIMWDFAGWFDNKGPIQELVNAVSYQKVLTKNIVRFVLVAPSSMLTDSNPVPFYMLLNELQSFCPHIEDSLCIVFTKAEKGDIGKMLRYMTNHNFHNTQADNLQIIDEGKRIIKRIVEREAFVDFRAPVMDGRSSMKPFTFLNGEQLVDCIKKLDGVKLSEVPLVISDTAKNWLTDIHDICYQMTKHEVEAVCREVDQHIQNTISRTSIMAPQSQLTFLKNEKDKVEKMINEAEHLVDYFNLLKRNGLIILDTGIVDRIRNFCFLEDLRKSYNKNKGVLETADGTKEFSKSMRLAFTCGLNYYGRAIIKSESATETEKAAARKLQEAREKEIKEMKESLSKTKSENERLQKENKKLREKCVIL